MNRTWTIGMLLGGITLMAGCAKRELPPPPPPPEVTVANPVVREVTDYFEFPGRTEAVSEVEIRARVMGYIMKVNFEDGQNVKKDQLLFEIDPRPYEAALKRAEGELARFEALRDKAEADLKRGEKLRPSGAVSQDDYEQRVAQLKAHRASIISAEAAVREAQLNLEFTKIVSPIDGRVSRARIKEGNLVQLGTGDATVLTTVVTTNPIYVFFYMDEQALLRYEELALRTGQELHPARLKDLKFPVEIALGGEEGFPHAGILDFADNKLNPKTGTIGMRGVFENEKEYLTPGLFCRVRIPFGQPHKALLISERAIGSDQKLKYLLVVNEKNVVESRPVKVGSLRDGMRVIQSGLKPDDRVIVNGLMRARPGAPVDPHFAEKEKNIAGSPAPVQVGKSAKAAEEPRKN